MTSLKNIPKILEAIKGLKLKDKESVLDKVREFIFFDKNTYQERTKEHQRKDCPSCNSTSTVKFGFTNNGVQRHRCKDCKVLFCDSTGSAIFRIKLKEKWFEYIELMFDGNYHSVRIMGDILGINHKTAFEWRHKLLYAIEMKVKEFHGIVEIDDLHYSFSQKGRRGLSNPKKRGHQKGRKKRGDSSQSVKVLTLMDRKGTMLFNLVRIGRLTSLDIKRSVKNKLDNQTNVLTSDRHPSIHSFAKSIKIDHETFLAKNHARGKCFHVNTINEKAKNLKTLINIKMKGVATKYLQNYTNWFKLVETLKKVKLDYFDKSFDSSIAWFKYQNREINYQSFIRNYSTLTIQ